MSVAENIDARLVIDRGLAEASPDEMDRVRRDMVREQAWLAGVERYQTDQAVTDAYQRGELELVGESAAFLPVLSLREPANFDIYQPYLRPAGIYVLERLGALGRRHLHAAGIDGDIRFPITSMVRSMERQAQLAAIPGKLALQPHESGHSTGWDVDLDSSSYYLRVNDEWVSVSRRDPEKQHDIAKARARQLGRIAAPTALADRDLYDGRVRIALHEAVARFYADGELSPVVEFANTSNEVIHLGIRPRYE
jgi:hypothetical protein